MSFQGHEKGHARIGVELVDGLGHHPPQIGLGGSLAGLGRAVLSRDGLFLGPPGLIGGPLRIGLGQSSLLLGPPGLIGGPFRIGLGQSRLLLGPPGLIGGPFCIGLGQSSLLPGSGGLIVGPTLLHEASPPARSAMAATTPTPTSARRNR